MIEMFEERLIIEAKNATQFKYRVSGLHPERNSIVYRGSDKLPELWEPLIVKDSFNHGGVLEVIAEDVNGNEVILRPGEFIDRDLARLLWSTIISFDIENSRGNTKYVVSSDNTMVYVPKCKVAIATGLPDGSVMSSIMGSDQSLRYTKCPFNVEHSAECQYPKCLAKMVTIPQPSIKAAKAAFRSAACVCLATERNRGRMLFFTNGPNHLNLVTLPQAAMNAWQSDYVQKLIDLIDLDQSWDTLIPDMSGEDARRIMDEKRLTLMGEEHNRLQTAEESYQIPDGVERIVEEEEKFLSSNIRIIRKKPKKDEVSSESAEEIDDEESE